MQDWVKMSRILALVERSGEHGFLIFMSNKPKVTSPNDLIIETAFPVNDEFKCEIGKFSISNFKFARLTYNFLTIVVYLLISTVTFKRL